MKRVRLDTTAYGAVPTTPDHQEPDEAPEAVQREQHRDDRWTIRRSAFSRDLVLDAQALFEERLDRRVSESEARNLLGNLADYVWMLVSWEVNPPEAGPTPKAATLTASRRRKRSKSAAKKSG